jgi:hypothetical protein
MTGRSVAGFGVLTLLVACGTEPRSTAEGHGSVGVYRFDGTALTAGFAHNETSACFETREGACLKRECEWSHAHAAPTLSAGLITATSGGRQLSVEPEKDLGAYPASFADFDLWVDEGKAIVVEATGGEDIGPFRAEIVGPEQTMIIEPPPSAMDSSVILTRGQPLFIAWREAKVGKLLAVASFMHDRTYGSVSCEFPASEGGSVIPGELLRNFNPAGAPMRLSLGIGQSTMVEADGFDIEVVAYTNAATVDGRNASFSVELQ